MLHHAYLMLILYRIMAADELSEYVPYVQYARRQRALRQQQAAERWREAWDAARRIADFLRQKYRPGRIIAFGSLLQPEVFHGHSDIDIAVDGIPWPAYLHAWDEAEELAPTFKIDLIDVGIVSEGLRRHIEEEGQRL